MQKQLTFQSFKTGVSTSYKHIKVYSHKDIKAVAFNPTFSVLRKKKLVWKFKCMIKLSVSGAIHIHLSFHSQLTWLH